MLLTAANHGHTQVVLLLLAAGADIEGRSKVHPILVLSPLCGSMLFARMNSHYLQGTSSDT